MEKEGGKKAVRRPMNAFLIFCKRHRSKVREENPKMDNRSITRVLGDLWAQLGGEEKASFINLAKQNKDAFMKANPDYKWHTSDKIHGTASSKVGTAKSQSAVISNKVVQEISFNADVTPGKLADPGQMGGLNLLFSAEKELVLKAPSAKFQHAISMTTPSPPFPHNIPISIPVKLRTTGADTSSLTSFSFSSPSSSSFTSSLPFSSTARPMSSHSQSAMQKCHVSLADGHSCLENGASSSALLQLAEMCSTELYSSNGQCVSSPLPTAPPKKRAKHCWSNSSSSPQPLHEDNGRRQTIPSPTSQPKPIDHNVPLVLSQAHNQVKNVTARQEPDKSRVKRRKLSLSETDSASSNSMSPVNSEISEPHGSQTFPTDVLPVSGSFDLNSSTNYLTTAGNCGVDRKCYDSCDVIRNDQFVGHSGLNPGMCNIPISKEGGNITFKHNIPSTNSTQSSINSIQAPVTSSGMASAPSFTQIKVKKHWTQRSLVEAKQEEELKAKELSRICNSSSFLTKTKSSSPLPTQASKDTTRLVYDLERFPMSQNNGQALMHPLSSYSLPKNNGESLMHPLPSYSLPKNNDQSRMHHLPSYSLPKNNDQSRMHPLPSYSLPKNHGEALRHPWGSHEARNPLPPPPPISTAFTANNNSKLDNPLYKALTSAISPPGHTVSRLPSFAPPPDRTVFKPIEACGKRIMDHIVEKLVRTDFSDEKDAESRFGHNSSGVSNVKTGKLPQTKHVGMTTWPAATVTNLSCVGPIDVNSKVVMDPCWESYPASDLVGKVVKQVSGLIPKRELSVNDTKDVKDIKATVRSANSRNGNEVWSVQRTSTSVQNFSPINVAVNSERSVCTSADDIPDLIEDPTTPDIGGDLVFMPVRKSRRANRGQKYQDLIKQGIIQPSKERLAARNGAAKVSRSISTREDSAHPHLLVRSYSDNNVRVGNNPDPAVCGQESTDLVQTRTSRDSDDKKEPLPSPSSRPDKRKFKALKSGNNVATTSSAGRSSPRLKGSKRTTSSSSMRSKHPEEWGQGLSQKSDSNRPTGCRKFKHRRNPIRHLIMPGSEKDTCRPMMASEDLMEIPPQESVTGTCPQDQDVLIKRFVERSRAELFRQHSSQSPFSSINDVKNRILNGIGIRIDILLHKRQLTPLDMLSLAAYMDLENTVVPWHGSEIPQWVLYLESKYGLFVDSNEYVPGSPNRVAANSSPSNMNRVGTNQSISVDSSPSHNNPSSIFTEDIGTNSVDSQTLSTTSPPALVPPPTQSPTVAPTIPPPQVPTVPPQVPTVPTQAPLVFPVPIQPAISVVTTSYSSQLLQSLSSSYLSSSASSSSTGSLSSSRNSTTPDEPNNITRPVSSDIRYQPSPYSVSTVDTTRSNTISSLHPPNTGGNSTHKKTVPLNIPTISTCKDAVKLKRESTQKDKGEKKDPSGKNKKKASDELFPHSNKLARLLTNQDPLNSMQPPSNTSTGITGYTSMGRHTSYTSAGGATDYTSPVGGTSYAPPSGGSGYSLSAGSPGYTPFVRPFSYTPPTGESGYTPSSGPTSCMLSTRPTGNTLATALMLKDAAPDMKLFKDCVAKKSIKMATTTYRTARQSSTALTTAPSRMTTPLSKITAPSRTTTPLPKITAPSRTTTPLPKTTAPSPRTSTPKAGLPSWRNSPKTPRAGKKASGMTTDVSLSESPRGITSLQSATRPAADGSNQKWTIWDHLSTSDPLQSIVSRSLPLSASSTTTATATKQAVVTVTHSQRQVQVSAVHDAAAVIPQQVQVSAVHGAAAVIPQVQVSAVHGAAAVIPQQVQVSAVHSAAAVIPQQVQVSAVHGAAAVIPQQVQVSAVHGAAAVIPQQVQVSAVHGAAAIIPQASTSRQVPRRGSDTDSANEARASDTDSAEESGCHRQSRAIPRTIATKTVVSLAAPLTISNPTTTSKAAIIGATTAARPPMTQNCLWSTVTSIPLSSFQPSLITVPTQLKPQSQASSSDHGPHCSTPSLPLSTILHNQPSAPALIPSSQPHQRAQSFTPLVPTTNAAIASQHYQVSVHPQQQGCSTIMLPTTSPVILPTTTPITTPLRYERNRNHINDSTPEVVSSPHPPFVTISSITLPSDIPDSEDLLSRRESFVSTGTHTQSPNLVVRTIAPTSSFPRTYVTDLSTTASPQIATPTSSSVLLSTLQPSASLQLLSQLPQPSPPHAIPQPFVHNVAPANGTLPTIQIPSKMGDNNNGSSDTQDNSNSIQNGR